MRLLNTQWSKGKLPLEKLPRLMEDYKNTWEEISEFFTIEDGLVFNERLERERVTAIARHTKAVTASNARWNAPSNAPHDAPAMPTQNSELITKKTEPKPQKERKRSAPPKNIYRKIQHLTISDIEYKKLVDEFGKADVDKKLDYMDNWTKLKTKKSIYLTALNWLRTDKDDPKRQQPVKPKDYDPDSDIKWQEKYDREHGLDK